MVFFRCSDCNRIWSKLVDNVCVKCSMPCEVLDWNPDRNNGVDNYNSAEIEPFDQKHATGANALKPVTDMSGAGEQKLRRLFNFEIYKDILASLNQEQASASDIDPTSGRVLNYAHRERVFPIHGKRSRQETIDSHSSSLRSSKSTSGSSDSQILPFPILEEGSRTTESCDEDGGLLLGTTKYKKGDAGSVSASEEGSSVSKAMPATSPMPTVIGVKKKNVKKNKSKKVTKKNRQPVGSPEKPVAQLELPDPISVPRAPSASQGWNQVLGKKAAKRSNKLEVAAHGGREVNASPHLMRKFYGNENDEPVARVVRFGLGGAKHDVKSTVPREVFEF